MFMYLNYCDFRVTWMKDGVDLGHSEPVLRINSITKSDRGMYQCFVRNCMCVGISKENSEGRQKKIDMW